MLEKLNAVNDVPVRAVFDPAFAPYGRVLEGFDFSPLIAYMEQQTAIPAEGNVYVPSVPEMEASEPLFSQVRDLVYGGMPIQIGYCNGRNTTYNGFEYHKGSEINVAVSDFCLVLGHLWQVQDNTFRVEDAAVFYVPQGTAIEFYQTTLHLSPCRTCDAGFRDVVILPRGTNTPLEHKPAGGGPEARLLLQKNKWVIAHPDRAPLIRQGAFPGLLGENKEVKYR